MSEHPAVAHSVSPWDPFGVECVKPGGRAGERNPDGTYRARDVVSEAPRGRRRVACVGFAESTRDHAPYDDPAWEIWGLNQLYRYLPRYTRWFELHTREAFMADQVREASSDYLDWMRQCPVPLYMLEAERDIPSSQRYPIEKAVELVGDYFQSTPAYMLTLALVEGFEVIGLYGIDLVVGREYEYERPNLEFILGIARALGYHLTRAWQPAGYPREILLPPPTAVCKQLARYGYDPEPGATQHISLRALGERREKLETAHNTCLTELHMVEGAIKENERLAEGLRLALRGGHIFELHGKAIPPTS